VHSLLGVMGTCTVVGALSVNFLILQVGGYQFVLHLVLCI